MKTQHSGSQIKIEGEKKSAVVQQPLPIDDIDKQGQDEDTRRQIYLNEHKSLVAGEEASVDQFDKNILTLAAGSVAISFVFLEKIAPHPRESTLVYLSCAWIGLVASLLSTLISFLTSQHAYRQQRAINDKIFRADPLTPIKEINWWSRITHLLNWTSIFAFIFGLSMLAWFGISNMKSNLDDEKFRVKTTEAISKKLKRVSQQRQEWIADNSSH